MIRLDSTLRKLELVLGGVVATTQPSFVASWSDATSSSYTGGANPGAANGATAVTLVAAPGSGIIRDVDFIQVYNRDTLPVTATVRYNDNATLVPITTVVLAAGSQLVYTHGNGWQVLDSSGKIASGVSGPTGATGPQGNPGMAGVMEQVDEQDDRAVSYLGDWQSAVANTGQLAGFRNKLINGGFDIWQRGNGPFTTSSYCADQWLTLPGTGATTSLSRNTVIDPISGASVPCAIWSRSVAGSTMSEFGSRIESVRTLAGKKATFSFKAIANANITLSINPYQVFGTGGSPSGAVIITPQNVNITTAEQTFSVTFDIPSIAGKTLGSANNDFVQITFGWPTGSANGSINIRSVQLEEGSIATPFEQRPIGLELGLCQQYYERCRLGQATVSPAVAGNLVAMTSFAVTKRTIPTMALVTDNNPYSAIGVTGTTTYEATIYGASGYRATVGAAAGQTQFFEIISATAEL